MTRIDTEPCGAELDKPEVALSPAWLRRRLARLVALAGAKGGSAALEFALATPVLVALLVPVADYGIAFSQQLQVEQAAQAGAQYAIFHPWTSNSPAAISSAVLAASGLTTLTASPAPSQTCGCPSGSAITTTSCGSI